MGWEFEGRTSSKLFNFLYFLFFVIALGTQFSRAIKLMQIVKLDLRVSRLVEKLGRQAPERVAEAN